MSGTKGGGASGRRISWWHPVMGSRESALLSEVVERNFPNDGEYTTRLEQRLLSVTGSPHAVAVSSGTAALALAVMACDIGTGDEVIVPDVTFIATANAVRLAGATPVLADVRLADGTLDPEQVRRLAGPRTRAVIPVHVSGRAADMPTLVALAHELGLEVIEDAAEALGSNRWGRPLGSHGRAGCFSFSPNKTITTGQGGLVVTGDAQLEVRLRQLKDQGRPVRGTGGADEHPALGFNFKLTNLQAAVGLAQLESLESRLEHQRQLYRWYERHLPQDRRLRLLPFDLSAGECPQWVDVWVEDRDGLHDLLLAHGIETRKFWYPIHTQAPYRLPDAGFDGALRFCRGALWLPSSLPMEEEDVVRVARVVKDWLVRAPRA